VKRWRRKALGREEWAFIIKKAKVKLKGLLCCRKKKKNRKKKKKKKKKKRRRKRRRRERPGRDADPSPLSSAEV
jgi:hypothetical protein